MGSSNEIYMIKILTVLELTRCMEFLKKIIKQLSFLGTEQYQSIKKVKEWNEKFKSWQ